MDISYQNPGPFYPYMRYPYGTHIFTPSPTPSISSESMFQVPLSAGRCQMNTHIMQPLSTTVADARRRKSFNARVPTRIEQSGMNFFQAGGGFSDQVSESGESLQSVQSVHAMTYSPCFQCPAFNLPERYINPFQYQPKSKSPQVQQFEIPVQSPQTNMRVNSQNQLAYRITIDPCNGLNPPDEARSGTYMNSTQEASNVNQPSSKEIVRSESSLIGSEVLSEKSNVQNITPEKKKGAEISCVKDRVNKHQRMRNSLIRKQRKKVQKKNKSLHKTELCTHWRLTSTCTYLDNCYFAHGIEELRKRSRVGNFKTHPCVDCPLNKGRCVYGSRCNYCHPGEAIRRIVDSPYYDKDYYNDLKMEFPNNDSPFGIFV